MEQYYTHLIDKIEEAMEKGDYPLAEKLVNDELAMPYVPGKVEEKLMKFRDDLKELTAREKSAVIIKPQELQAMLKKGGEAAMNAINGLQAANARNYLAEIEQCLQDAEIHHLCKVLLCEVLISQKVDENLTFISSERVRQINPAKLSPVSADPVYLQVLESLEKLLNKNPSFLQQAQMLATNLAYDFFPDGLKKEDTAVYVYSIIRYLYQCYGEERQWEQFAASQGVEESQLLDLHY
jgi:hypothetical protein